MSSTLSNKRFLATILIAFCANVLMAQRQDTLSRKAFSLGEATVLGNSLRRINHSALNAIAIDVSQLHNTNLDVSGILSRVSGIRIRQNGGVGSSTQINLNGFTGKHVKLFVDGVPMDGSSSAFGINNIPASVVSRIEVYKGVVPVEFGADALGGAINIVTNGWRRTFIDASYSFGSFNTHRTTLHAGVTTHRGFTASASFYQNYSDNNYKVWVQNTDLQTLAFSDKESWFKRFHDRYHNETAMVQIGVVDKSWADKLLLGLTYSREYAQVQNTNLMKIVFGAKHRRSEGFTPRLSYAKRHLFLPNLDFNLSAKYDIVTSENIDTAARTYNWAGEYITKSTQGEGIPTISKYRGKTAVGVVRLTYRWRGHNSITVNDTYSNYRRRTDDKSALAVQQPLSAFMRRINMKNVLGVEYKFVGSERWNALAMAKHYSTRVRGPVNISTIVGRSVYEEQARNSSALGYGVAGTYHITQKFQVKSSFEKTARLPNVRELFGDGDYEIGEASLKPERSYNINLNLLYETRFANKHYASIELGANSRNIRDYIIRTISSRGTAISTNYGRVRSLGIDFTARYAYADRLTLTTSYALQNTRNRERLTNKGAKSIIFGDRVPNIPYSFGNAELTYKIPHLLGKENTLMLGYGMQYMHRFFRSWQSEGAKLYVPKQFSHDFSFTYALKGGIYNISLEANNITNERLYDNYSLQKPGRSFAVKFRYSLQK